jgi:hypothetical protein
VRPCVRYPVEPALVNQQCRRFSTYCCLATQVERHA